MAKKPIKNSIAINEPRINDEIDNYKEVRLIYKKLQDENSEEDFVKIVSMHEARKLSKEYSLDLIEINAKAVPPVLKLADYSKYLWNLKKQAKAKTSKPLPLKEVQLSVNISDHDIEIKAKKALEFINEGHKVKVILTIKGRELSRREYSKESFYKFLDILSDKVSYDTKPRDEGNKCYAIIKRK